MLQPVPAPLSRTALLAGGFITLIWFGIYAATVSPTVNFIDSGEIITALHEPGILHPPGYPLYTLLGYVASQVPMGEVAWRVNLMSSFWAALAVGCIYLLLLEIGRYMHWHGKSLQVKPSPRRKASKATGTSPQMETEPVKANADLLFILSAAAGACLLGASSTFWNRAVQAKMYTLHYFFVALLFLLALEYRWAAERNDDKAARRLLVALCVTLGLSFTNHLMTSILVPGIVMVLLWGKRWQVRLKEIISQWKYALPAVVLPLLLYLYLPVRSAQDPVMNWGAPTTFPDFWRHVTGWQYKAYLLTGQGSTGKVIADSVGRLWGFMIVQWSWLSSIVLLLAVAAAVLFARANGVMFAATLTTALLTFVFAVVYTISEIEPYLVPFYMMLIIWLGSAPVILMRLATSNAKDKSRSVSIDQPSAQKLGLPASITLAVLAAVSGILQFPLQNHSNDHLAELFVLNTFSALEPDSIVLTDHWDFYSPTYYLQLVKNNRPDLIIIDKSSLRYPWYLGQLRKRYPALIAKSEDIAGPFSIEQGKWVNGEPYDSQLLNKSYIDLLTSFVERNYDQHPAYTFFTSPDPEDSQIASSFVRQQAGVALRLWREAPSADKLPPQPQFDLRGYTHDSAPLDEFARYNAHFYLNAYRVTAQAYLQANQTATADTLISKATELDAVLKSR